jgi:putative SOS response-associated peptidase YedK
LHRAILVKLAGERVRSFAIITTTPNELCAELHNRRFRLRACNRVVVI